MRNTAVIQVDSINENNSHDRLSLATQKDKKPNRRYIVSKDEVQSRDNTESKASIAGELTFNVPRTLNTMRDKHVNDANKILACDWIHGKTLYHVRWSEYSAADTTAELSKHILPILQNCIEKNWNIKSKLNLGILKLRKKEERSSRFRQWYSR